jgi:hypothetical protein
MTQNIDSAIARCRYDSESCTEDLIGDRLSNGVDRDGKNFGCGHRSDLHLPELPGWARYENAPEAADDPSPAPPLALAVTPIISVADFTAR